MARPATVMVGKIVPKSCGNPKKLPAIEDKTIQKLDLGRIFGIASEVVERTAQDGTTKIRGMGGSFEAEPFDETMPISQSGICYLPDFIMNQMLEILAAKDKDGKRINGSLQFAFKVAVVRAENPQGYSWEFTPITEVGKAPDPLAQLKASVAETQKQIEAPKGKGKAA